MKQLLINLITYLKRLSWIEEYYLLGQNKLSLLKDNISCFRNEICVGEFSENPEELWNTHKLKVMTRVCYFLINN